MNQSTIYNIQKLYKTNKYQKALELIQESIKELILNKNEKIELYELERKIYKILKRKEPVEFLERYSDSLYENHEYHKASINYSKSLKIKTSYKILNKKWKCELLAGEISNAEKTSGIIIKYLMKRKNQRLIREHINEANENKLSNALYAKALYECLLIEGDVEEIDKVTNENNVELLTQSKNFNRIVYQKEVNILKEIINFNIKNKIKDTQTVKDIFNFVLAHSISPEIIEILIDYSLMSCSKKVAESVINNVEIKDEIYKRVKKEKIESLNFKINTFEEFVYEEEFDSATDLFLEIKGESTDMVLKFEKQIKYLRKIKKEKDALEVIQKLKLIDPENKFVREYHDELNLKKGSKLYQNDDDEKLIRNLIAEIAQFDKLETHHLKEASYSEELKIRKSLSMNMDFENQRELSDVVSLCMMLNYLDTALVFIEKITNIIEREYLKALIYYEKKKYYKSIVVIDELIEQEVITEDEKINCVYIQAECYRKLGNIKESVIRYNFIKKKRPSYRLVRQRLLEFENI